MVKHNKFPQSKLYEFYKLYHFSENFHFNNSISFLLKLVATYFQSMLKSHITEEYS